MNVFEKVSGNAIRAIWNGMHSVLGNRLVVGYDDGFTASQQEPIVNLVDWQLEGAEDLLVSYDDQNPDIFIAWVIDWDSDRTDRPLLAYNIQGSHASFTRKSMTEARTGDITDIEIFHRGHVLAYLAEKFGSDGILVAEVEHDWDVDTYTKLGFTISNEAYVAPILEGADAPGQSAHVEEGGIDYRLAGIRFVESDVPITDEELAEAGPVLDAIYAAAKPEEEVVVPELEVGELRTVVSEIDQPPTVESGDAN